MKHRCDVYRTTREIDCTLGGISSKYDALILVDETELPYASIDGAVCLLKMDIIWGEPVWRAFPLDAEGKPKLHGMMGGNFAYTSDSRFPPRFPICIMDRFER